jgi:hypothetical protein
MERQQALQTEPYTVGTYRSRSEAEAVAKRYRASGRYIVKVIKRRDEEVYRIVLRTKGK